MSTKKEEPQNLLAELEMLQRVLETTKSGENNDDSEFSGDIPVLDDMFDADIPTLSTASAGAALRAVPTLEPIKNTPKEPTVTVHSSAPSQLSPLNQVLDKINKQGSNIEAVSAPVLNQPAPESSKPATTAGNTRAEIDAAMSQTSASLTSLLQRERLVDELVEEMLPLVKGRLRSRIRDLINQDQSDKS